MRARTSKAFVLLALLVLTSANVKCGGKGIAGQLTCQIVTSPDNCWHVLATSMIDCMGGETEARLVAGDFDATATVCTDTAAPTRTATFNPSRPTDSLVNNWYTGSFTLRHGETECGTVSFERFEKRSALSVTVNGETAVFMRTPYYEFVCPDGSRFSTQNGGNIAGCTRSIPGINGAVNFETNGRMSLSYPEQPLLDCSLQTP